MSAFTTTIRRTGDGFRQWWRAGVEFVFLSGCLLCGVPTDPDFTSTSSGGDFCIACRNALAPHIEYSCRRCAAPVGPHLDTVNGCIHCRHDRFAFSGVIRLGVYSERLRSACLTAKEPGGRPLAAGLARLLVEQEIAAFASSPGEVVVPVPRHWTKRLNRSHDTAETLAWTLSRRLKLPYAGHILAKVRVTAAQSSLSPSERRANLKRAFRSRAAAEISGRKVLLIDDVLTTGTTAHEASKALLQAGAAGVVVAVVARGIGQAAGV